MEQEAEELKKDISELEILIKQAERQKVKDILSIELRRLGSKHANLLESLKKEESTSSSTPIIQTNRKYRVKLNNYAWDQSQKYVKFFFTVEGVHNIPSENITCSFTSKSLELDIKDLNEKDYFFTINKLLYTIDPESSTWKVKTDMVVISAVKVDSLTWSHVTEIEKKNSDAKAKKYDFDESDPNDSLKTLMRRLYDEGDDEMKRSIVKACTGQNKEKSLDL
ncbi:calcyclin-binding protein-like [Harmonia axyridis]|uniref:calcyclin-binding protein-like n=1 Tax=Harmonia axyridis TaxID=115357 RepID=UPI001E2797AE|nr:calcyclin-binding protein-like [Harmonia axyridis]XP_045467825.1 calcyclin-binding protein-like [Harmonia axyridis]XP_045467826.1 calcyclin-binding protein-like [Harmonia axyridis]